MDSPGTPSIREWKKKMIIQRKAEKARISSSLLSLDDDDSSSPGRVAEKYGSFQSPSPLLLSSDASRTDCVSMMNSEQRKMSNFKLDKDRPDPNSTSPERTSMNAIGKIVLWDVDKSLLNTAEPEESQKARNNRDNQTIHGKKEEEAPQLPAEIVLPILNLLDDFFDKKAAVRTCRAWSAAARGPAAGPLLWAEVALDVPRRGRRNTDVALLAMMKPEDFRYTQVFTLTDNKFFTGRTMVELVRTVATGGREGGGVSQGCSLTELDLSKCSDLDPASLVEIARCLPNLRELGLYGAESVLFDHTIEAVVDALAEASSSSRLLSEGAEEGGGGGGAARLEGLRLGSAAARGARPPGRLRGACLAAVARRCPRLRRLSLRGWCAVKMVFFGMYTVKMDRLRGEHLLSLANPGPGAAAARLAAAGEGERGGDGEEGEGEAVAEGEQAGGAAAGPPVGGLPLLEDLDLALCGKVRPGHLEDLLAVPAPPPLAALNLKGCWLFDDLCAALVARQCPALRALNLSGCDFVTGEGLRLLATGLIYLEDTSFCRLNRLTDEDIFALVSSRSSTLKQVALSMCDNITTQAAVTLCLQCKLTSLNISSCKGVNAVGLFRQVADQSDREAPLSELTVLNVKNCGEMNDEGLRLLLEPNCCGARNLELLYVGGSKIISYVTEDAKFGEFLPKQQGVGHKVTDAGLARAADLLRAGPRRAGLEALDLEGCAAVRGPGLLRLLRAAPHLRKLGLRSLSSISDDVADFIQHNLPKLQELDISNTGVAPARLERLRRARGASLRRLIYESARRITLPH